MTAGKRRVALVSDASETRTALAHYLTDAGFDVHQCDDLTVPSAFAALVLISRHGETVDSVIGVVRAWMRTAKTQRIVVVTSRPKALTGLVASYGERLRVLPAPVFAWDLVDALRSSGPVGPRSA